ncbi:hypothetical protein CF137_10265 [Aeromonas sobria]|nr:hypothetical protein CF137_10265 [Aeromonas sobria]
MKNPKRPDNTQLQACNIENVITSAVDQAGLVKLLHSPSVDKRTIELPNDNIFHHKHHIQQINRTIPANYPLYFDILL